VKVREEEKTVHRNYDQGDVGGFIEGDTEEEEETPEHYTNLCN
jgi:hypothetical protein